MVKAEAKEAEAGTNQYPTDEVRRPRRSGTRRCTLPGTPPATTPVHRLLLPLRQVRGKEALPPWEGPTGPSYLGLRPR